VQNVDPGPFRQRVAGDNAGGVAVEFFLEFVLAALG
jgi:hypothetical protein